MLNISYIADFHPGLPMLGEMASKIAYYNFEWRYNTLILFNAVFIAADHFLKHYDKGICTKKGKYVPYTNKDKRPHITQFIVFGHDSSELADILQWMVAYDYDNTGKFVVICSSSDREMCDEVSLFQTLAETFICNVIFLRLSDTGEPEAFTYYPILPNKCWNTEPKKLDYMVYNCKGDSCYLKAFPEKFLNMHLCQIAISTFEQPPLMYIANGTMEPSGSDGDVLKLVTSILNASLIIRMPPNGHEWGHFEPTTNNWTGSLGDVFNGRAQGSMCSIPLTPAKYGNFQISFTYNSMDMVWAARLPTLKPSWEKLLYPFGYYVRIALLLVFFVIILMSSIKKSEFWYNVMKVVQDKPSNTNLLFYSWRLFLGLPALTVPWKFSFRALFCSWLWFCTIIRCVYQGALIGSLKQKAYQDNLNSFDDVLKKKYPYGGFSVLREYYSEDPKVYNKWTTVDGLQAYVILDKICEGSTDFVIAMNRDIIVDYLLQFNGRRQLQIIPEKIVNSPTVIYFKKHSHLESPMSRYLTIALEGGFTQRLYVRYMNSVKMLLQQSTVRGPEPLRLVHFTGSLIILFIGWILAFIFFVVEFFYADK